MTKNKEAEIVVWWDMNKCPIPFGFDACEIGPLIDTALMNAGYCGPLTINAMGNLENIPDKILQELSSTGILIKEVSYGISGICDDFVRWEEDRQSPANMMLISDSHGVECFSAPLILSPASFHLNILFAYPKPLPRPSGLETAAEWIWDHLLWDTLRKQGNCLTSKAVVRPNKSVESAMFFCYACERRFAGNSFKMFKDHLHGEEHALTHWEKDRIFEVTEAEAKHHRLLHNPSKGKSPLKRIYYHREGGKFYKFYIHYFDFEKVDG